MLKHRIKYFPPERAPSSKYSLLHLQNSESALALGVRVSKACMTHRKTDDLITIDDEDDTSRTGGSGVETSKSAAVGTWSRLAAPDPEGVRMLKPESVQVDSCLAETPCVKQPMLRR